MSAHLARDELAGLATLAPDDPERRDAEAHAAACPECAERLAEAVRAMALLDALPAPAPADPAVLARIRASIHAELDADAPAATAPGPLAAERATAAAQARARPGLSALLLPPALATTAAVLLVALARHRHGDSVAWVAAFTGLVTAAVAMLVARSGRALAAPAAIGGALAASLAFLAHSGEPSGLPHLAVKCSLVELAVAALPLVATAWLALRARQPLRAVETAAVAAAGALAGQAALVLTCPQSNDRVHVLAFHVLVVALAAGLGSLAPRLPALRRLAR